MPKRASTISLIPSTPQGLNEETAESEDGTQPRAEWGGKLEFILTCIGYAVGLGNVWRFPYLCYKNGGGAFLIPYTIMLIIIGVPFFFLEISFGQFASLGPITIWKINPLFKGLGYAMVSVSWMITLYYNVIIAWAAHFFGSSMRSELLWVNCDQSWNTGRCRDRARTELIDRVANWTNASAILKENNIVLSNKTSTPSEEYFYRRVLNMSEGMEDMGLPQWELVLCLLFAWIVVFLVLWKGIQSLGKVSYFTASFPYILLTIMLVRGCTLPGAVDGIIYYVTPQWHRLAESQVWSDAATQIFYALSACCGGLITMSSYNKFNNNVLRDALIVPVVAWFTCLLAGFVVFAFLGYIAHIKQTDIATVASASGPGLVFVVYPEGLAQMPVAPLWSVLFFFMLLVLGFSSSFSYTECVFTSIMDEFPQLLKQGRRPLLFRGAGCLLFFCLGIPMVTRGGFHLFNIMDTYVGGFPLLVVGIVECLVLAWVYGFERLRHDIELMLGKNLNLYFRIMWCYLSPAVLVLTTIFKAIEYTPIKTMYGREYPPFAKALCWLIVAFCLIWIPIFFLVHYCKVGGYHTMRRASVPSPDWGPALKENRLGLYDRNQAVAKQLEKMNGEKQNGETLVSAL